MSNLLAAGLNSRFDFLEVDRSRVYHYGLFNEIDLVQKTRELPNVHIGRQGLFARNLTVVLSAKLERFIVKELNNEQLKAEVRLDRVREYNRVRQARLRLQRLKARGLREARERELVFKNNSVRRHWCTESVPVQENEVLRFMAKRFGCDIAEVAQVLDLTVEDIEGKVFKAEEWLLAAVKGGRVLLGDFSRSKPLLADARFNFIVYFLALLFLVQRGVVSMSQEGDEVVVCG